MKIIGIQGFNDPRSIRDEVDRGARFIVYHYCISIVVMTFKRTSDIHFVRLGQSAVFRGLPCSLISFFLGWWGFPWGLVYTIEVLVKNLGGGTDVTQAVLAQIAPPRLGATTAEADARTPAATPPPPMPLRGEAPSPSSARSAEPRASVGLGAFRFAALLLAAGFIGWTGLAFYRGANVETALVNGLATPLTVTLDGTAHTLDPNAASTFTLAEGEHTFVWTRPDGRVETDTFAFKTPFWSRPLDRSVAILNPDRTALVYRETTRYYPTDQTVPEGKNDYELHAGSAFYTFPAADYFFADFPAKISLSNREAVAKSRHAHAGNLDATQRFIALSDGAHEDQLRALALRLGELYPDNEILLNIALSRLRPEDTDAFFASHLEDRPLRLEWHRFYQHHIEQTQPGRDLLPRYRQLAAESPDDGAAAYLVARIETDAAARAAYLRQAVGAAHPCAYAHNSLAFEALVGARFADALVHLRAAEQAGLDSFSFRHNQCDILLANHLVDEAIGHLRALRAKDRRPTSPTNRPFLVNELVLACQAHPEDRALETPLTAPYLASIKPFSTPEQLTVTVAEFAAVAAYARGDEAAYAERLAASDKPENRFAVAITRGHAGEAATTLGALPKTQGSTWLLVHLAARAAGDSRLAEDTFAKALAAFDTESREHRALAARLRAGESDPAALRADLLPLDDKCVIATVLGHRFPQHRAAYHELAAQLNFKPEFPARFLARQLATEKPVSTSVSL